ncbi:MAG TPA: ComF family protein [Clostridiaceae bacterium]|nr:ComF family protein [Clostridiaceae bacterium]
MMKELIGLLFPPKCIFCSKIIDLKADIEICRDCYKLIPFVEQKSVIPFSVPGGLGCCDGVICACRYTGIVRDSLIKYKFYDKSGFCRAFARLIAEKIKNMAVYREFDVIVSVPLHKRREHMRGYNQSLLISRILSRELKLPEKSKILKRKKETHTQSLLPLDKRRSNLLGAFEVKHTDEIKDKTVLLVDDIMTTGITLNECSKVLKEAGAKKVIAAVVASGRDF